MIPVYNVGDIVQMRNRMPVGDEGDHAHRDGLIMPQVRE